MTEEIEINKLSWKLIEFNGEMVFTDDKISIYTGEKPRTPIKHVSGSTLSGLYLVCAFTDAGKIRIERADC